MTPPTIEEAKEYAKEIGVPDLEAEKFWYYFDSQDWKRANGLKLSKWRSALQVWKRNIRQDSRQTLQDARREVFNPGESIWSLRTALKAHKGNPNHIGYSGSTEAQRAEFKELLSKFEAMGGGRLND
jgi:hypothetical protein